MTLPPRFRQCRHLLDVTLPWTIVYCLALSSSFVCSLYALVPSSVRRLPRDDASHIKWRAAIVVCVATMGAGAYPLLFCRNIAFAEDDVESSSFPPWYAYLGFSWRPMQDIKIAVHVLMPYLGALTCSWLRIYHLGRILRRDEEDGTDREEGATRRRLPIAPGPKHLLESLDVAWIRPTCRSLRSLVVDEDQRWTNIRNLAVAPLAEEVVFRACLLPPLLACGGGTLSPAVASWIAPLFFGVAHLHHLHEQYKRVPPGHMSRAILRRIFLGVMLQFAYTTLFGAYVSHVFVRTGSLGAATIAHVVCNYMGLPEVGFAHPTSNLHGYRYVIASMYLVGIGDS